MRLPDPYSLAEELLAWALVLGGVLLIIGFTVAVS